MAGSGGTLTWSTTSISLAVGETITVNYTTTFNEVQSSYFTQLISSVASFTEGKGKIELTGTNTGSVTVGVGTRVGFETVTTNELTIIVTAPVDDQNFLNERGLAHFWENIDNVKQDKLTAGDHINISNNTIKATDYVHSDNPVPTSSVTPVVTNNMIATGTITADKFATGEVLKLTLSTSDIGEGSPLASNTLYGVYE